MMIAEPVGDNPVSSSLVATEARKEKDFSYYSSGIPAVPRVAGVYPAPLISFVHIYDSCDHAVEINTLFIPRPR